MISPSIKQRKESDSLLPRHLAEWVSTRYYTPADRAAIAADIGTVVAQVVPVTCVCCDRRATHGIADWDLCAEHYNALSEPDSREMELIWP